MARKSKKKVEEPPPTADDGDASTEEESVQHDNADGDGDGDASMGSEDDIPDIVDKDSDEDDDKAPSDAVDKAKVPAKGTDPEKKSKKKDKKSKKEKQTTSPPSDMIPFMDTFYQLSSEDSPRQRSIAARDLIRHCLLSESGVNAKDAAYALTRLLNGVCAGRAASRQGFASCLSSFLRVAHSVGAVEDVLKEDEEARESAEGGDAHPEAIVRSKLLSTTRFLPDEVSSGKKGDKKKKNKKFGGGMKGIEERDHAFGRLFGILAVVRSGILGLEDFPSEVVEGYTKDLIDLYHYKKWMREPSAHAIIELLSSLDAGLTERVTNSTIIPVLFLPKGGKSVTDRAQWLQSLTPEQIAVGLHLQTTPGNDTKYNYPLDEPLVTAESIPMLSAALASTSGVVHPRCHVVWNALWTYLTEEAAQGGSRQLRANGEFPSIVEGIVEHVVVDLLLGKGGEGASPTNERRSLALQIVCALCGSSELKITLPPETIGSVLTPNVVTRVFTNVLCATGGQGKSTKGKEHHLKPLTSQALADLVERCCEDGNDDADRRMAFVKAFVMADPRFDAKTKTSTISSLLMLEDGITDTSDDTEKQRAALCEAYLSFLEEQIISAASLHDATLYIELMYKFAKRDLGKAPADDARRAVRFFMSGAFFDCSGLSDPSPSKTKKKKKAKTPAAAAGPPQELSSGLRIKEILKANGKASINQPVRAVMSSRFYNLLFDFVTVINSQNRGGNKAKAFYGKGSRPESIYRALSEISGICSLLETSGAKKFPSSNAGMDDDDSDSEDPAEASRGHMLQVQKIADEALVEECDGSGDKDILRAKSVCATGCAALMMSLHLQLNRCGKAEEGEEEEDEENDEAAESIHEYVSDLADCVDRFCRVIEDESCSKNTDDAENPLAMLAGLLVNILSSPAGGEDSGNSSASKLTREAAKLAWSSVISVVTSLNEKNESLKSLVDEDVMSILIESVCGEKSMGDEDKDEGDDDESMDESDVSEDGLGNSAVFVDASEAGMDLEDVKNDGSDGSKSSEDDSSEESTNQDGDEDVELDPAKLENLLLEDSDAEMSDSGMLEHHSGADKALAQLIKLKQDARKASQTERERVEFGNRLRCAGLLDFLFSQSVFKSGWLPIEAVLGSIVPILRSYKAIEKSIHSSSSANSKKSLGEKSALLGRLTALIKDKVSKFRCSDGSGSEEVALKAASDIYEEMRHSVNLDHCVCCSVALITAVRCIPNVEESDEVKDIYAKAIGDWSSRKATKIHSRAIDDLIQRMPSLASVILVDPLITASSSAHSPFMKCEAIKLLANIFKHDTSDSDEVISTKARSAMKLCCANVAEALKDALGDSSLLKVKNGDEVLVATKHFVNYVKAQSILLDSELCSLQDALKAVGSKSKKAGTKKICEGVSDTISTLARRDDESQVKKPKRSKAPKAPKSGKKTKSKK